MLKEKVVWICLAIIAICVACVVLFQPKPVITNDNSKVIKQLEIEKKAAITIANEYKDKFEKLEPILAAKESSNKKLSNDIKQLKLELASIQIPIDNPYVEKQAEIIKAQELEIVGLKDELQTVKTQKALLLGENSSLKTALNKSELQHNLDIIAKDAQIEAIKNARNKGRIEGGLLITALDLAIRLF